MSTTEDRDLIGTVTRQSRGQLARCSRCDWTLIKTHGAEAEASLRSHANLIHPQPIKVYR